MSQGDASIEKVNIAQTLKTARKEAGLSVKEVSVRYEEITGEALSPSTIYGWESAQDGIPLRKYTTICKIYGLNQTDSTVFFDDMLLEINRRYREDEEYRKGIIMAHYLVMKKLAEGRGPSDETK